MWIVAIVVSVLLLVLFFLSTRGAKTGPLEDSEESSDIPSSALIPESVGKGKDKSLDIPDVKVKKTTKTKKSPKAKEKGTLPEKGIPGKPEKPKKETKSPQKVTEEKPKAPKKAKSPKEENPQEMSDINEGWEELEKDLTSSQYENLYSFLKEHKISEIPGVGAHTEKTLCKALGEPCTMASFLEFGLNKLTDLPSIGKEKARIILEIISKKSGLSVKELLVLKNKAS